MTGSVAARKVAEIRSRVARVIELLPASAAEMLANRTATEALLLNLYLALQAASDLSLHVVAEKGLGVPSDARSAIQALVAAGLMEPELGERLSAAIGMRDRIAHQYGTLDLALVHAAARDGLSDLEDLAAVLATALGI